MRTVLHVIWVAAAAIVAFAADRSTSLEDVATSLYGIDISMPIFKRISTNYPWLPHNTNASAPTPRQYENMPIQQLGNRQAFYNNVRSLASTPNGSFNLALGVLAASLAVVKILNKANSDKDDKKQQKDPKVKSLQLRFLMVFWLLRMADWLQVRLFCSILVASLQTRISRQKTIYLHIPTNQI
jgi:hypothetical protein